MSLAPLPIDERRVDRIMREIEDHETTCRRGVARCETCAALYSQASSVVNLAATNARAIRDLGEGD